MEKGRKKGRQRGLLDVFSDGLHLKRGAFTFCSPLLLQKSPHILSLSLSLHVSAASVLNLCVKEKGSLKCCLSQDGSHLHTRPCHYRGHCGEKLPALNHCVYSSVCLRVGCRSSQVIFLVLPVYEDSICCCVYTLQQMDAVGKQSTGEETSM